MNDDRTVHPLTRFIADLEFSAIPAEVAETASLCVLDTCAAMVCGAVSPVARIGADYALSAWRAGRASVLATGARQSAVAAAFANAIAANGTDLDDVGRYTWGHPGAMIVPTALALAEESGATGAMFCTAIVIGYEVAFRAGRCVNFGLGAPAVDAAREYRACGSWGAAACAAVAAHLAHLPSRQIAHALGIADYHAPEAPMMRDLESPAMVKHANGIGAMTGIQAAGLASKGFTGIVSRLYSDAHRAWVLDIGREYLLPRGVSWKRFSCCSFAHAALDALEQLRRRYGPFADRVRRIRVQAYSDAVRLGARVPDTSEEAQFSISWPLAVMAMDGEVHPRAMSLVRVRDPRTRALAGCVEVTESADLTARYLISEAEQPGGEEAAIVAVELDDGTVLGPVKGINVLFPDKLPGRQAVEEKFRWAAADALPQTQIDAVCRLSRELPRLGNLQEFARLLVPPRTDGVQAANSRD
jgi:2-methylcitrate dehydratase PrpD